MIPFKKHILVCSKKKADGNPCCHARGGLELADMIRAELYKKGLENDFPVTSTGCLGVCESGPVVIVYPDAIWYPRFQKDEVERLIFEHLTGDKPMKRPAKFDPEILAEKLMSHNEDQKRTLIQKGKL